MFNIVFVTRICVLNDKNKKINLVSARYLCNIVRCPKILVYIGRCNDPTSRIRIERTDGRCCCWPHRFPCTKTPTRSDCPCIPWRGEKIKGNRLTRLITVTVTTPTWAHVHLYALVAVSCRHSALTGHEFSVQPSADSTTLAAILSHCVTPLPRYPLLQRHAKLCRSCCTHSAFLWHSYAHPAWADNELKPFEYRSGSYFLAPDAYLTFCQLFNFRKIEFNVKRDAHTLFVTSDTKKPYSLITRFNLRF